MAIERRGSQNYYYVTRRVGEKVIKSYIAGGLAGRLAAQADAELRREHRILKVQEQAELQRISQLEANIKQLHKQVENLAIMSLYAAGFRRHAGGEWRRRRC
jgi:hypothetical protein